MVSSPIIVQENSSSFTEENIRAKYCFQLGDKAPFIYLMRNTLDRYERGIAFLCHDSFGKMQTSSKNHYIGGGLPYAEEVNNTLSPASNAEKDEEENLYWLTR